MPILIHVFSSGILLICASYKVYFYATRRYYLGEALSAVSKATNTN